MVKKKKRMKEIMIGERGVVSWEGIGSKEAQHPVSHQDPHVAPCDLSNLSLGQLPQIQADPRPQADAYLPVTHRPHRRRSQAGLRC